MILFRRKAGIFTPAFCLYFMSQLLTDKRESGILNLRKDFKKVTYQTRERRTNMNKNFAAPEVSRAGWKLGATERINKLRDDYFANGPEVDTERSCFLYEDVQGDGRHEHFSEKGKGSLRLFFPKDHRYRAGTASGGTYGKKPRAAVVNPDVSWKWVRDELDTMSTRPQGSLLYVKGG